MSESATLTRFANELDALVERFRDCPLDDRLTGGELVGALQFKSFTIMQEFQQMAYEDQAEDEDWG